MIEIMTNEARKAILICQEMSILSNFVKCMEDQRSTEHEEFKTAKAVDVAAVKLLT